MTNDALLAWLTKDSRRVVTLDRRTTEARVTLQWWEWEQPQDAYGVTGPAILRHRQRVVEQNTMTDALKMATVIADAEAQGKAT